MRILTADRHGRNRAYPNPIIPNSLANGGDRTLKAPWIQEFRDSAIPDSLALANIEFWEGEAAVDIMVEASSSTLGNHAGQYATEPFKRLRKSYQHFSNGAWFCFGTTVDGSNLNRLVPYAKPSKPRQYFDNGKVKTIKYETPRGNQALPILPCVDADTAALILNRYRVKPIEGESFWQTVERDQGISIGITEGVKKALAMTALGLPTIALRGIATWHPKGTTDLHYAIGQFAIPGRRVYIAFDQDIKPSTVKNVRIQAIKMGNALEIEGSKPSYIEWPGACKGIDDAIATQAEGDRPAWFDGLLKSAKTLNQFSSMGMSARAAGIIRQLNQLSYPVERSTEGEYLPTLPEINKGEICVISANQNSGKSTRIGADLVRAAKEKGGMVLVLSPRNTLGTQTSAEWGLPHINDKTDPDTFWTRVRAAGGVVLCPDSSLKLPQWFLEQLTLLVADECNRVIEHTLEGETLGIKYDAVNHLLGSIIQRAIAQGSIVLSEDGLPDRAVNYIRAIAGLDAPVRVFTHKKNGNSWNCKIWSGSPSGFRARVLDAIGTPNTRHLFVSSSAAEGRRLERAIDKLYPHLKVVRIDGKTNQDSSFTPFFLNPDQWLQVEKPDVLILSPSAESGVSIEGGVSFENAYFTKVWGYFPVLGTDTHSQLTGRYRPAVDREVFVPKFIQTSGDEAISTPWGIKQRWKKNSAAFAKLHSITAILDEDRDELSIKVEAANAQYLAESRAVVGAQKAIANDALVQRLEDAGHRVSISKTENNTEVAALYKECQEELWREDAHAIALEVITEKNTLSWARETLDSHDSTENDRTKAHKALWRDAFPGISFDCPEGCYQALVKDYGAMKTGVLLQTKAENLEAAKLSDASAALAAVGGRIRSPHRLPKQHARAWVYAQTKILELLDGQTYSNSDPRAIAVKAAALRYSTEIRYWLGLNIKASQTPSEICNKLLAKIGIRKDNGLEVCRPGAQGQQGDRFYRVDLAFSEVRTRLLEAARSKASDAISTISIKDTNTPIQIVDMKPKDALYKDYWASYQYSTDPSYRAAVVEDAIAAGLTPNPQLWSALAA